MRSAPRPGARATRVDGPGAPGSATPESPDTPDAPGDPTQATDAPPAPPESAKARLAKAKVRVRDVEHSAIDVLGRLATEADVDIYLTPAAYDSWTGPGMMWSFGIRAGAAPAESVLETIARSMKIDVRADCVVISWKENDAPDPATLVRAGRRPADPGAPAPKFTIAVTDPGGGAVPGAVIWHEEAVPRIEARTDASGTVSVPVLVASGALFATAPGFQRSATFRYPRGLAGGDRLEVRLGPPAAAIRGVVRTPDGAAVADAGLRAVTQGWKPETGPPSLWTRTDANGVWTLDSLAPGPSFLEVHAKGWAIEWLPLDLATGPVRDVDVRLHRPASVRGTIRGKDGAPVAEAGVYARMPGMPYDCVWVYSGADGKFVLEGLPPGNVCLRAATLDGARRCETELAVREGEPAEWEAVLPD